ncbi:hypothetical protein COOONC_17880 [Cooperia oncophora]
MLFEIEADAEEKSPLIASHVKGTLAYLPPEFITNKILSTKLDVYSFGIVLLEICTELLWIHVFLQILPITALAVEMRKNVDQDVRLLLGSKALMDKRTPCVHNQAAVVAWCDGVMFLGLKCADKDRHLRPPFPQILESLSNLPSLVD